MVEKVRRSIMLIPPILTLVELVEVQLDLLEELGGRIVAALDQQNVVAANETTPFIADLVIWQPGRAGASRSSCPRCASCRRCARWRCGRCRWRCRLLPLNGTFFYGANASCGDTDHVRIPQDHATCPRPAPHPARGDRRGHHAVVRAHRPRCLVIASSGH